MEGNTKKYSADSSMFSEQQSQLQYQTEVYLKEQFEKVKTDHETRVREMKDEHLRNCQKTKNRLESQLAQEKESLKSIVGEADRQIYQRRQQIRQGFEDQQ